MNRKCVHSSEEVENFAIADGGVASVPNETKNAKLIYLKHHFDGNNWPMPSDILRNHRHRNADNTDPSMCGGTFRGRQTTIESPRFPQNYPSNVRCEYVFQSPYVCKIEFHIQFLEFALESSPNCAKDRVAIGEREILCGKVIGIMKYTAENGVLRIVFTSDATVETDGFQMLITRLPCVSEDEAMVESEIDSGLGLTINGNCSDIDDQLPDINEPVTNILPPFQNNNTNEMQHSYLPVTESTPTNSGGGYLPPAGNGYLPPPSNGNGYPNNNPNIPSPGVEFPLVPANGYNPAAPPFIPTNGYPSQQPGSEFPLVPANGYNPSGPPFVPAPGYPSQQPGGAFPPVPSNGYNPTGFVPGIFYYPQAPPGYYPQQPPNSAPPFYPLPFNPINPSFPPNANCPYPNSGLQPHSLNNPEPNAEPQITPLPIPVPAAIPQCCRNSFGHRRFFLVSPGFPNTQVINADCLYHIVRNNPGVCSVRIEFKYFLLGPHDSRFGCTDNYIEIDGRRICGCNSGLIYTSQWGPEPKTIRLVSTNLPYGGVKGFVLNVVQEECPYRLSSAIQKRSIIQQNTKVYLERSLNNVTANDYYRQVPAIEFDVNNERFVDKPNARFFYPNTNGIYGGRCIFSYPQWLSLASNQFWLSKPICVRP